MFTSFILAKTKYSFKRRCNGSVTCYHICIASLSRVSHLIRCYDEGKVFFCFYSYANRPNRTITLKSNENREQTILTEPLFTPYTSIR